MTHPRSSFDSTELHKLYIHYGITGLVISHNHQGEKIFSIQFADEGRRNNYFLFQINTIFNRNGRSGNISYRTSPEGKSQQSHYCTIEIKMNGDKLAALPGHEETMVRKILNRWREDGIKVPLFNPNNLEIDSTYSSAAFYRGQNNVNISTTPPQPVRQPRHHQGNRNHFGNLNHHGGGRVPVPAPELQTLPLQQQNPGSVFNFTVTNATSIGGIVVQFDNIEQQVRFLREILTSLLSDSTITLPVKIKIRQVLSLQNDFQMISSYDSSKLGDDIGLPALSNYPKIYLQRENYALGAIKADSDKLRDTPAIKLAVTKLNAQLPANDEKRFREEGNNYLVPASLSRLEVKVPFSKTPVGIGAIAGGSLGLAGAKHFGLFGVIVGIHAFAALPVIATIIAVLAVAAVVLATAAVGAVVGYVGCRLFSKAKNCAKNYYDDWKASRNDAPSFNP